MISSHMTVVSLTTAILASLFTAALLALLFICRQRLIIMLNNLTGNKKCVTQMADCGNQTIAVKISPSTANLIDKQSTESTTYAIDPEDLIIHPDLDKLSEASRWKWIDDALGIVPHCLKLLRGCHTISEKLVATAMSSKEQGQFVELASVAQEILPLVDDLLRSMCPPIEARVIENRAGSLMKAVKKLGSLIRRTCNVTWPNAVVCEMNSHYQQLKILADQFEGHNSALNSSSFQHSEGITIMESSLIGV